MPLIRDAEIEQLLRDYTQPILSAAGLAQQKIQIVIINERAFNAFVMDGRRIFVNAGALMDADDAEPGHWRARARDRPHRRRPPVAPARAAGEWRRPQSIIAMLSASAPWWRRRAAGAGGNPAAADRGPAGGDPPLAALLHTLAGGAGRPRRREVPRPPPVNRPKACTRPSSGWPTKSCSLRTRPILTCSRIQCRPNACGRSKRWPDRARTGTRRIRQSCKRGTT